MNPLPVGAVGGDERPAPEAPEDVAATGLSVATFRIGRLGEPPQFPRKARAGETQNASVHVINALLASGAGPPAHPANELSVMNPHDARIAALNGTSMWCVRSYTESIAPAAPHLTLKSAARDLEAASRRYAKMLGVSLKRVSVRDQSSRWGSCSSTGVLSFSWRLILAPAFVLEYLAAHEICHLVELNHSPRFWRLVKRLYADVERAKVWLDVNGTELHRYGLPAPRSQNGL